jgi:zinc transporter, ZIP family
MWIYTLIPVMAAVVGAALAAWRAPGPKLTSAIQHFAAGVVFAAAAGELLPDLVHRHSMQAIVVGGALGLVTMLAIRWLGERLTGSLGLIATVAVDILVDGLVLGIGFAAGPKQGLLLTIALTIEILFLGLSVSAALSGRTSPLRVVISTGLIALLLPVGAIAGTSVASLPERYLAPFFAFGLIAFLYLVTEELLVEAHEKPDSPSITALFFVGFLLILLLDEALS